MEIIYNPELNGYQIVYLENIFINPNKWGKSINGKLYTSWEEASSVLDKLAE